MWGRGWRRRNAGSAERGRPEAGRVRGRRDRCTDSGPCRPRCRSRLVELSDADLARRLAGRCGGDVRISPGPGRWRAPGRRRPGSPRRRGGGPLLAAVLRVPAPPGRAGAAIPAPDHRGEPANAPGGVPGPPAAASVITPRYLDELHLVKAGDKWRLTREFRFDSAVWGARIIVEPGLV